MKLNRVYLTLAILIAVALVGCKNDDPNDNSFDNKLYIDVEEKVSTLMVKPNVVKAEDVIHSRIAKPAEQKIEVVYGVEEANVAIYNKAYYDNALMLPEDNYELLDNKASIPVGGVRSTDISVNFKSLNMLDREKVYVLPISIVSASNIDLLSSARTVYYVFKSGAVINVVANISDNHFAINWVNPSVVRSMGVITMEALVKIHQYNHINTIMGIENNFLLRIGDTGYEPNALQVATSKNNFPASASAPILPTNQWVHVAVTMTVSSGAYVIYLDGKVAASGNHTGLPAISLDQKDKDTGKFLFFIGKSYNDSRWMDGEIAECRIWNVIRTKEQIAANALEVDPTSPGLVAYWKFDEGIGSLVNDRTSNKNNGTAAFKPKWIKVTLPE